MNFNFKNKNVFISGGTHGIGLACLLKFAELQANVITFARDKKKINLTKKKLDKLTSGIDYLIDEGDILDINFLKKFSKKVLKKYKTIDILIHNVGGGGRWGKDNFLFTDSRVWKDVYDKNNNGLIIFTKYFLPSMLKNQWGRVIAIGSILGFETTSKDRSWFSAAKAAQSAIIKSFSKKYYFTKKNITFNTISPGPIFIKNTGWDLNKKEIVRYVKKNIPTKNMGIPEDIACMCVFLSSFNSSYINGSNIVIDGGYTNSF